MPQVLLPRPISQGYIVHWATVGPVLAFFLIASTLLVLIIIVSTALYKRRRSRCSGGLHNMLQITAFSTAILITAHASTIVHFQHAVLMPLS